jgi:hypothetical protein
MTQENDKNPYIDIIIDFVKNELLKSDFKEEILQPLYINMLYYIIPLILLIMLMNFITTLIALFIVMWITNKSYH